MAKSLTTKPKDDLSVLLSFETEIERSKNLAVALAAAIEGMSRIARDDEDVTPALYELAVDLQTETRKLWEKWTEAVERPGPGNRDK